MSDNIKTSKSSDSAPAKGSDVPGGYEGQGQQGQSQPAAGQAQAGEKQDWLDKGIESAGKKFGVNISDENADKAGDFINKEFTSKAGHGLPGVR